MRNYSMEMLVVHLRVRERLKGSEVPVNVSWKLVEVGQGYLAGYKEVYLATQMLQMPPPAYECLEFARQLHECISKAFQTDKDCFVFVLSTVSITRNQKDENDPLFLKLGGDEPPPKPKKWDSDVEINLGPGPDGESSGK